MTGPYPPDYGAGPVGPQIYAPQPYPEGAPSPYPAMLPPPLQYPKRQWWKPVAAVAIAVVVVAALVTAIVFASRDDDGARRTALTDASAKAAIQEYLDALSKGDDQTVARHTLCGLFDAVKEHRSDLALAEPEQRRVPQAVQPCRGDLDRQDGAVVAESGAGAVHDESGSGGRVHHAAACSPSPMKNRLWRSCSPRTTRSWCAPTCRGRPASSDAGAAPAGDDLS